MAMEKALITAENVRRGYSIAKKRIEVLKGIDLSIKKAEKVFLCGPSGAGKTTLMYTLAGLEEPDDGQVMISAPFAGWRQRLRMPGGGGQCPYARPVLLIVPFCGDVRSNR